MKEHGLVLFTVDGVLVDSGAIRARCWAQTLVDHGYRLDRAAFQRRFEGRSDAAVVRSIEAELGKPLPVAALTDFETRARRAFDRELSPIPDVRGTLKRLRLPICALAGGSFGLARHGLEVAGLWRLFAPNLFTMAMVAQEHPAPDLPQYAASQMGVSVHRSLMITATVNGVRAGRAAGMTVFGFAGAPHAKTEEMSRKLAEAGAMLVFDRMRELAPLVHARAA